ncbi:MAG: CsgG/HfaB family protein [Pseudomonadota bacterium]|nr:CsgG/HfaB family protein [Pseudomonadota bacterium]
MRKNVLLTVLLALTLTTAMDAWAAEKPRIGVLRFTNNTHAAWWHGTTGENLQDMLINELAATKRFTVVERKELDAVLSEQKLGASGLIRPETAPGIGKLTGARYLVAATVSAFEEDVAGSDQGVSFMGLSVGGSKGKAYIAVDLKVIDAESGEIADVRTVEGTSDSSGLRLGLNYGFFSGTMGDKAKTPTGKAIRACIVEISEYLDCSLLEGNNSRCMAEYNAKESKRRQKTKGAINIE